MNWVRTIEDIRETINLQTSQFAGVTANLYTKDLKTEALLLEAIPWKRPLVMIASPTRIGFLMDGTDHWWMKDPDGPAILSQALMRHAPPYFESQRSLEDQAKSFGRASTRFGNGADAIYLALTLYRMGEIDEALDRLSRPPRTMIPYWRAQVESVQHWLQGRKERGEAPPQD
jgi:hypothetical protein